MERSEAGVSIAISPVQLAAVLVDESLSPTEILLNRVWGGARVLGGVVELLGAGVLCAVPEPTLATKVGCVFVGAHGTDTLVAGVRQLSTGHSIQSLTEQNATALAEQLGASDNTASTIGLTVDVAVSVTGAALAGAVRIASIRAGRISLALHEAPAGGRVGGHTIARHIGQTVDQMRARLAATRLRKVSSFSNLNAAETAISKALRANALQIKDWSRSASAAKDLGIEYRVGTVIGQGVARGATEVSTLRSVFIVLRRAEFNGMPYYILTAFPI